MATSGLAMLLHILQSTDGAPETRAGILRDAQRGGQRLPYLVHGHIVKEQIALVGDQLLTDVACGNRAGFTTFVVKPINPDELWITKWNRNYEKLLYRLMGIKR